MSKHKAYIGIKNEAKSSTLELHFTDYIYDGIDWDTWETTNMVQETINKIKDANPETIKIVINSLGGDVMIGLALYNYLKNHKAEKEVEIIGFAASIASVMAMSASAGKLKMAKNSFMIIHAAWSYAIGTATDIREQADQLDKVTGELADIYAQRSGKKAKHFTDMWAGGDVWLTGEEALKEGLADELFNSDPVKAHAEITTYGFKNIPPAILNQVKEDENPKTFFSNLKTEFMNIFDSFKAAISGARTDKKYENVPERNAVLDMIEETIAKAEADAREEEKLIVVDEKKEEVKEEKPEEKKVEEVVAESEDVIKLKAENKKLAEKLAAIETQPEKENVKTNSLSKVKIEYEN